MNNLLNNSKRDKIAEVIRRFRENRKIVDIQRAFLKKLLLSKAGMVVVACKKIISLPERKKDPKGYDQFLKFERGLHDFWSSTMKRSYVAIKNELEEGQTIKKRAVIQLINLTQGSQKRMYNRWLGLTEKSKLINECKVVSSFLASLTSAIKSATDSSFLDSKENQVKEKALIQLFKNMNSNVESTFKRWR